MQKKNLTIIIVTYDSSNVIKECLDRIDLAKYPVIVVDNNSSDDTRKIVKDFKEVKLITLEKNIGYGRANNIALSQIDSEFALILNPDASIDSDDIEVILSNFREDQKLAIAAPLLLNGKHGDKSKAPIDKAITDARKDLINEDKKSLNVNFVIGAVTFLRVKTFKNIGFYDENIFLYSEDSEICWRAINQGYKCLIIKDAFGYHFGGKSSGDNLKYIYRRGWHRAFSKFYWKQKRKGKLSATKSALRVAIFSFVSLLIFVISFRKKHKVVSKLAYLLGTISYIIGLGAFDKNGNHRA